jgi:hypothetical protein
MTTLTTTPGEIQHIRTREPGDAAAQMRDLADRLDRQGDLANAIAVALQAGLSVAAFDALHEQDDRFRRLIETDDAECIPAIIAAAVVSTAMSMLAMMAPRCPERELVAALRPVTDRVLERLAISAMARDAKAPRP